MEVSQQTERPFVSIESLTFRTPTSSIYENVSFSLYKGQVGCLLGNAGSGKTSLLLTLGGRMRTLPKKNCTVGGYKLGSQNAKIRQLSALSFFENVNEVQEGLKIGSLTGAEMRLVGRHAGKKRVMSYLESWNFADKVNQKFNELSTYDATRFGIMLGCVSSPQLLVVDDVQSGLTQHESIKLVEELKTIAREHGIAILFGCNEYDVACHADGVVLMSQEAKMQRRAVLRDKGEAAACPIIGVGNGVRMEGEVE